MTFEEFQATRRFVPDLLDTAYGENYLPGDGTRGEAMMGLRYAQDYYIEISPGLEGGPYYLLIENHQWVDSDLAKLERELYDWWLTAADPDENAAQP